MSTRRVQKLSSLAVPLWLDESRTLTDVAFPPVVAGDRLLITRKSGALEVIKEHSGELIWSIALAKVTKNDGAPLLSGDLVYVCAAGELISIDFARGAVADRKLVPALDFHEGALINGSVVSYVAGGRLEAWDLANGTRRWSVARAFDPVPLAGEANMVVAGGSGSITAYDVRDGHELWTVATGDEKPIGAVVVAEGSIVAAVGKEVVCLDGATGAVRWNTEANVTRAGTMAVSESGEIHLMDLVRSRRLSVATGALVAAHELDRSSMPAIRGSLGRLKLSRSHVFGADQRGPIIAVSQQTGSVDWKWEEERPRRASVAPVLTEHRLYALDINGTLQCFVMQDHD